jgi:hypothetical protein
VQTFTNDTGLSDYGRDTVRYVCEFKRHDTGHVGMSGAQTCMCELASSQASLESSHILFSWMGKELMYDIGLVFFSCYVFMLVLTPNYSGCSFDTHLRDFRLPPRNT